MVMIKKDFGIINWICQSYFFIINIIDLKEKMKKIIVIVFLLISNNIVLIPKAISLDKKEYIKELIEIHANSNNISVKHIQFLIQNESNYNPNARGAKGEYGLGQILCSTAKSVGYNKNCNGLLDPDTNVRYTVLYVKRLLEVSDGDYCHALFMYKTGKTSKPSVKYCNNYMKGY
jgi:soluble lytic murein transglycosylase-like protein